MRAIYCARPLDSGAPLKNVPDRESESARWVDVDALRLIADGIWPWGVS
jgi:hypothetical protein